MTALLRFLLARLDEDEKAIKSRNLNLPIHFVGCYYYSNTLDAGLRCDCDEDGEASKKALAEILAKKTLISSFNGDNQKYIVATLSKVYSDHPDYHSSLA